MAKRLDLLALLLVVVGALNWGLVGLFKFDPVAKLVGEEFGRANAVSRIIYVLVALAGLALIPARARAAQPSTEMRVPRLDKAAIGRGASGAAGPRPIANVRPPAITTRTRSKQRSDS